jgi:hypothetical protein
LKKKNKSRVAPLTVKADLKHPTYVYTGGESDFKILIMVFPIQRMSTIQSGIGIQHPLPRPRKTTIKQLRLERDGYSNIIILGTVAQLVEHLPEEQGVGGSIPPRSTES